MKSITEACPSAADYASLDLELKSSAVDNNAWLISYLDIFILTAALFASLLAFEQNQTETNAALTVRQPFSEASADTRAGDTATDTAITSKISTTNTADATEDALAPLAEPILSASVASRNLFSPENNHPLMFPASPVLSASPVKSNHDQWQNSTALAMQRHAFDSDIQAAFRKGYAEISIGSAVLFAAAEAKLLTGGTQVLDRLVGFLKEAEGIIVIQGHTDSSPIKSAVYPSNWELASARANNVLHYLLAHGLKRERLRAVSFADTQPLVANDSESNRQKNRRVNIVLLSPETNDLAYHKPQAPLTSSEKFNFRHWSSAPAAL